jgi:hypothetical protein
MLGDVIGLRQVLALLAGIGALRSAVATRSIS